MNNAQKIKQLELELALIKAKASVKATVKAKVDSVAKCKEWVKAKRKGDFIKAKNSSYTKKNGEKTPIKVLSFSNGENYAVSTQKFWKIK